MRLNIRQTDPYSLLRSATCPHFPTHCTALPRSFFLSFQNLSIFQDAVICKRHHIALKLLLCLLTGLVFVQIPVNTLIFSKRWQFAVLFDHFTRFPRGITSCNKMSCCCHVFQKFLLCLLLCVPSILHLDPESAIRAFWVWQTQIRYPSLYPHLLKLCRLCSVPTPTVWHMVQPFQFRILLHIPARPRHNGHLLGVLTSFHVFHVILLPAPLLVALCKIHQYVWVDKYRFPTVPEVIFVGGVIIYPLYRLPCRMIAPCIPRSFDWLEVYLYHVLYGCELVPIHNQDILISCPF
nr:MAG TPA: hypothetical protein [Caudoviricetes sp.]